MAMEKVEYMCSYCGKKEIKTKVSGKPLPGKCPRKSNDRPHSWVINRKL